MTGAEKDLAHYLRLARKRWLLIAVGILGALALAMLQTARTTPVYRAEAKLFVGVQQVSTQEVGEGAARVQLSSDLFASYAALLPTRSVAQAAVERANLPLTAAAISDGVRASGVGQTHLLAVSFDSSDPRLAQQVVNAVSDAFVDRVSRLGVSDEGEPAVRVEVVDQALQPSAPISPQPVSNIILGLLLGLAVGVGAAFLAEALDVTVKSREEVEALGLHVVGAIPTLERHGADIYLEQNPQVVGGEAFRKLRTSIGFLALEHPLQILLVASSQPQEGKTTVALNLAAAYAQSGLRTLLVEADLRRPSLHRLFGLDGTRGLTTAIIGEVPLEQAVKPTDIRHLSVMLAGAIPPNPVELLDSEQMTDLLGRLRTMFDIVVLDSPPLAPVADPIALTPRCDGVILVARAGKTHRRRLVEGANQIERAGGRLLGVLLNCMSAKDAPYDYADYSTYRSRNLERASDQGGRAV